MISRRRDEVAFTRRYFSYLTPFLPFSPTAEPGPRLPISANPRVCITALTVRPRRFFSPFPPNEEPGPRLANRKLKQRRRRQQQIRCLKLHRTYSISFNSPNVGKLFWCCILKDCIEVQGNKKKVVRHFHVVFMQRRQRNIQKSVMHVQSCCFIFLIFAFLPFSLRSSSLPIVSVLRGLSVLERRTSTGSEAFSRFTCLDDIKFVLLCFFTLTETI